MSKIKFLICLDFKHADKIMLILKSRIRQSLTKNNEVASTTSTMENGCEIAKSKG